MRTGDLNSRGGPNVKKNKWMEILCVAMLTLSLAAPAAAWGQERDSRLNDSEEPGSVLVFPKFIKGTINDVFVSGEAVHAVTELEISVVCPKGATCARNPITGQFERVFMRAHWVCGGTCAETSFDLETTVNGSLYFNPEGVTVIGGLITANAFPSNATTTIPEPPPGCEGGYLIVWVTDGRVPIKFDGLIGDAIIREVTVGTFPETFSARAYNAIPIQAASIRTAGAPTDVSDVTGFGPPDGKLDFNGIEYQAVTGKIFGTVRYENAVAPGVVETDLTLLTLDVASNRPNPETTVGLNFYTTDEDLVDTATSFFCWTEQRLTGINPGLIQQRMGRKGLVESTYAEQRPDSSTVVPVTLLGIVETKEFGFFTVPFQARDYTYSLYNDSEPVVTTFAP
jgi:hypothetical protein